MALTAHYAKTRYCHINSSVDFEIKIGNYTVTMKSGQYRIDCNGLDQDLYITDSSDVSVFWFPLPVFF